MTGTTDAVREYGREASQYDFTSLSTWVDATRNVAVTATQITLILAGMIAKNCLWTMTNDPTEHASLRPMPPVELSLASRAPCHG